MRQEHCSRTTEKNQFCFIYFFNSIKSSKCCKNVVHSISRAYNIWMAYNWFYLCPSGVAAGSKYAVLFCCKCQMCWHFSLAKQNNRRVLRIVYKVFVAPKISRETEIVIWEYSQRQTQCLVLRIKRSYYLNV